MSLGVPLLQPPSLLQAPVKSAPTSGPTTLAEKRQAVGTIPVVPSFYIMERTAIQLFYQDNTNELLDRILVYLKNHSIRYECEPDTGCFDCTSPNQIEFAVQLWRARDSTSDVWVEVQRRHGCSLAMNAIRRSLLRHIQGEPPVVAASTTRRPCPDNWQQQQTPKRQRKLSPEEAQCNCQEALAVAVQLLESHRRDQQQLGLESLAVMTNPRLVCALDASTVSKAMILGEGPIGARLQQRLVSLLQEIQPTLGASSSLSHYSYQGSILASFYHFILYALANALAQVSSCVDLKAPFWHTVTTCLRASLEDSLHKPHEATLAAKCLRFLLPSKTEETLHQPTLRSILIRTHEAGKTISLALEEESQKTLSFL